MTVSNQLTEWQEQNQFLVSRGIEESTWAALCSSVYPGANQDSVVMAIDYCKARGFDIMLKPVHLVPISVKRGDNYVTQDVVMPGIGLYRIQASRNGDYAGANEPEFGSTITRMFRNEYNGKVTEEEVSYPEWCKYTVSKIIGDRVVQFSAKEYWTENYATQSRFSEVPNAMWKKRPFAQLAKCTEAQALRRAWPEIGQEPTAEEMEGKAYHAEREINSSPIKQQPKAIQEKPEFTQDMLDASANKWAKALDSGKSADDLVAMIKSKYELSDDLEQQVRTLNQEEAA
jgi:phage recombination protein Bet